MACFCSQFFFVFLAVVLPLVTLLFLNGYCFVIALPNESPKKLFFGACSLNCCGLNSGAGCSVESDTCEATSRLCCFDGLCDELFLSKM